ncbi:hypothetical protein Pyn_14740 [Prunus yedoensis var. nudiflora]|uniref:Uncharacterized protein n=1 Tax=Prunus yedoensis var. nudiflora TaxID=2094558 RepID=A0A314ZHP9_PRUYE|nr:hypothetical protein Pyn_14740 [Prunus yedoensis var. nudiflora]
MEDSAGAEFPGFQTCAHKNDTNIFRRHLSHRLQRRAPCILQLNPNNNVSSGCSGMQNSVGSSSNSSSSSLNSFYQSKDPIPLLSPLVLLP